MATITTIDGGSQTLTGTFDSIAGGMATFTTCSLASGGTLAGSSPFGQYVDGATADTVHIPLGHLVSVA